ncbi:ATP-dependent endonuclease [Brevundimonas sp. Leaf168]|uniref:ATP-dependent nuclease n=1 Tax=Brevundimonas sp. Leaf168 TaxID=1736283 RepID=UPI0009E895A4|nr:AAA family ATPase [Brevundimonas sp. Leaf168]
MLLEKLTLQGFRRFHEPTEVNLSGKMVAIVGSNEAGKTSLLNALRLPLSNSEISYSDRTYLGTYPAKLIYHYFLEASDLEAAKLNQPSWLHVHKLQAGNRTFGVHPRPDRDFSSRDICEKSFVRFLASGKVRIDIIKQGIDLDFNIIESALPALQFRGGPYDDDHLQSLEAAIEQLQKLENADLPLYATNLREQLNDLVKFEKGHDPHQYAINILSKRLPPILYFGATDRDIGLPYSLALYKGGDVSNAPSKPLSQVISLSKLDMDALVEADQSGNEAVKTGLLAAANEELRKLSEGLWSQSDACLFLTVSNGSLDILVEHKDGFEARDRYNNLRDRSDGYRQFVALQIFAFLQSTAGAILLIDEIDQHLHYDAQADLIQLLQKESSIQKVIYTTHSAGALPEDLGTGVRLVLWNENEKKYSRVNNKFWVRAEHEGFRPLLFGMGAATLAFFPTRKALIAEGVTEMLLLPKLLRDALGRNALGFQIIHGLANISPKGLPMIDEGFNGVAYIVDGDAGGKAIADNLKAAGVSSEYIFNLKTTGCVTVEDIIEKKVWKEAIISLLRKFNPGLIDQLSAAHFPEKGRVAALPALVASRKVEIAYEILDLLARDPGAQILSAAKKDRLKKVGEEILASLSVDK